MIQEILANFASVQVWLGLAVGVIGGMVIGAMPGLSGGMAIALLLPVTYSMEPVAALVMLMAIYTAAMTGGSISAILLHTPGTPANAATAFEALFGYVYLTGNLQRLRELFQLACEALDEEDGQHLMEK